MKAKNMCVRVFTPLILGIGLAFTLLFLLDRRIPGPVHAQGSDGYSTYYVAPSCTGASNPCFISIQAAVDTVDDPDDVVKVAAGTYTGINYYGNLSQIVYLSKTVTIRGGYTTTNGFADPSNPDANPTILDAQGQGRVLYITGDITPTVEGFHITGGNADGLGDEVTFSYDVGGGVCIITATAIISNNRIFKNVAETGGGIYLIDSIARLINNTVNENKASRPYIGGQGGGVHLYRSPATLIGNLVAANVATSDDDSDGGGGLFLQYSPATLIENTIVENVADDGGGVYLFHSSGATLRGNTIVSNTAVIWGGGLYLDSSAAILSDNTIAANTGRRGAGLHLASSPAMLIGNVVASNISDSAGGGLWLFQSAATLQDNTIISNVSVEDGGGLYVGYSAATLDGNIISANRAGNSGGFSSGGGLHLDHSNAILNGNVILTNVANQGGGLVLSFSDATLTNNVVADNQAIGEWGGSGVHIISASPRLLHTTVVRNYGGDGAGIYITNSLGDPASTVTLTNTILVSHTVGIYVRENSTANLNATLWDSMAWASGTGWDGPGIISHTNDYSGDPAFLDPDTGDYHIGNTSVARDTGVNAGVEHDIDSQFRPIGRGYDIGADEYPGAGLEVAQRASTAFVNPDQVFTYTLVITSTGLENVTDVILTDTLDDWQRPINVTSSTGSCAIADIGFGGMVVCSHGTLGIGSVAVITLTVQASATVAPYQSLGNTVVVGSNETTNFAQITIYGQDCHVRLNDSSTEYTTVQVAVDVAHSGGLVKVAGTCLGTRMRAGKRQQVYVDKSLVIQGGYTTTNWIIPAPATQPTILDALESGRVFYITGTYTSGTEGRVTIKGLRITGGDASGQGGAWDDAGGGLYATNASVSINGCQVFTNTAVNGGGMFLDRSNVVLRDNTIATNTAEWSGGGVFLHRSDATVDGNTITANTAEYSGGLENFQGDIMLVDNTVSFNVASEVGGGISVSTSNYPEKSAATLNSNTIISNTAGASGGGLLVGGDNNTLTKNYIVANVSDRGGGLTVCHATLKGNVIIHNTAKEHGGGLYICDSNGSIPDATVVNNVIADNQGSSSVYAVGSSARLLHNTIAHNGDVNGAGLYLTHYYDYWGIEINSDLTLVNNILVGYRTGIYADNNDTAVLEDTLWGSGVWANTDDWDGTGTISTTNNYWGDPAFVDADAGDYHIRYDSAALDVGTDTEVIDDIDGEPRVYGLPDLGADELGGGKVLDIKITAPNSARPGSQLTYSINITNTSSVTLHAIITNALPPYITPVETSGGTLLLPHRTLGITWTTSITGLGGTWAEMVVATVADDYDGKPLMNIVEVTTEEGVAGRAYTIINPYKSYLPLVKYFEP